MRSSVFVENGREASWVAEARGVLLAIAKEAPATGLSLKAANLVARYDPQTGLTRVREPQPEKRL